MSNVIAQYVFEKGKEYDFEGEKLEYIGTAEIKNELLYPRIETLRWLVFQTKTGGLIAYSAQCEMWDGRIDIRLWAHFLGKDMETLLSGISNSIKAKMQTAK